MNREEVKASFILITLILTKNDLLKKPDCGKCHEIGIQLTNDPNKMVVTKVSKDVNIVRVQ